MPLKYEITNIDELPEQLRPMYVERAENITSISRESMISAR